MKIDVAETNQTLLSDTSIQMDELEGMYPFSASNGSTSAITANLNGTTGQTSINNLDFLTIPNDEESALELIEALEAPAAGNVSSTTSSLTPLIETSDLSIFPSFGEPNAQIIQSEPNSSQNTSNLAINNSQEELALVQSDITPLLETEILYLIEDFQISIGGQTNKGSYAELNNVTTDYGHLSIDNSGNWQYTVANELAEVQALGAGDLLTETIELVSDSGVITLVEIRINGTNDQPIISGQVNGEVSEDSSNVIVNGKLFVSDTDSGESAFIPAQNIESTFGIGTINAEGNWTYALNNELSAVQGLNENETLVDYFFVSSADGTQTRISIEIEGHADTPIFDGSNKAQLDPTETSSAEGKLNILDADFGESHFVAETNIIAQFGKGSISVDGHWSYELNNPDSVIFEGDTVSLNDSFNVNSADGSVITVIVEISSQATHSSENETSSENITDINIELENALADIAGESINSSLDFPALNQTEPTNLSMHLQATPIDSFVFSDTGTPDLI